jgi:uncharacterized Zn-binding protein involved in type VI secretion
MPAAARKGDEIQCEGEIGYILDGSPNVFCNGLPLARVGDPVECFIHGAQSISGGSGTVFANGSGVARVGDPCSCGAIISSGSPNVFVGG